MFYVDFEALGRLVMLIFGRAAAHTRRWIAVWFASILVLTGIAAISHASSLAYVILLVVAGVVVFVDGDSSESS